MHPCHAPPAGALRFGCFYGGDMETLMHPSHGPPAGAFRFGYFYGGDMESVIKLDLRNAAAFVRDARAAITNVMQPLKARWAPPAASMAAVPPVTCHLAAVTNAVQPLSRHHHHHHHHPHHHHPHHPPHHHHVVAACLPLQALELELKADFPVIEEHRQLEPVVQ